VSDLGFGFVTLTNFVKQMGGATDPKSISFYRAVIINCQIDSLG
jgi:hypothetical protein